MRLCAIAGMVTKGNRLADVGCDHGYLSIYLVEERIVPSAIAMDVVRDRFQELGRIFPAMVLKIT